MPDEIKDGDTLLTGKAPEQPAATPASKPPETQAEGQPKADPKPEAKAEEVQKKDEPVKKGIAPETYADFKLPEGFALSSATKDLFVTMAKEANLSQEAAQKLVDLKCKLDQESATAVETNHKAMVEGWKAETLKALGANAKDSLATAARARDQFGTPEFNQMMDETGLGNHPAFVAFCVKAGKAISEDGLVTGKGGSKGEKSLEDLLYPSNK